MREDSEEDIAEMTMNLPGLQLATKNYSLDADMATGWRPKQRIVGPIPFNFDSTLTDLIVDEITSFGCKYRERVVYLGNRYASSFKMHQEMKHCYRFKYEGIANASFNNMAAYFRKFHSNFKSKNQTGRIFKGMNPTLKPTDQLIFDSNFQSGNLDAAIKVNENQYDLFMRVDTNTRGHIQWFNFTIKNNGRKKVKLNIVNFRKFKTLLNRGLKPYIFSEHLKQTKNLGWFQGGHHVKYEKQKLRYEFLDEEFSEESISYNCLKFQYVFENQWETVQFAYCPPFTYSEMLDLVIALKKEENASEGKNYITQEVLCESLGGLNVPLLTITDPQVEEDKKKCILAWARIHPGQTCGSHMMTGFLKYICSNSEEVRKLRKNVVFKVIPMLNVDGVVAGNFRTSFCGKDLNRQFRANSTFLIPEVKAVKELLIKLKQQYRSRLVFFLDMHGHSVKKNVFLYGPGYEIWETNYYKSRIFPKILSSKTEMFRYYSCLFRVSDFKKTTARAVFLASIPYCYTIQASTGFYYLPSEKKDLQFTPESWGQMGQYLGEGLKSLIEIFYDEELTKQEKRIKMDEIKVKKNNSQKIGKSQNKYSSNQKFQTRLLSVNSAQKHKKIDKKEGKQSVNLPLSSKARLIIDQIKQVQRERELVLDHQSDKFSEGGSDSQGSEDDIPEDQLQKLQKEIINSIKQFQNKFYHKNERHYSLKQSKKKICQRRVKNSVRIQTRESGGIQMIASLRKKAQNLQKTQQILQTKFNTSSKHYTTNIGKQSPTENLKSKINYQIIKKNAEREKRISSPFPY